MTFTNTRMEVRYLANLTTDPRRTGEKMLKAAKANVNLVKKVQTRNLLEGLEVRRLGTNEIETMAKKLVNGPEREKG